MRIRDVVAAAVMAATTIMLTTLSNAAAAAPAVDGLIVRLKTDARQSALALAHDSSTDASARTQLAMAMEAREKTRLAAVLGQLGARLNGATIAQPVGRAAHLLRWAFAPDETRLQAAAALLASQPDVESVEFDTTEQRLSVPEVSTARTYIPSDPMYPRQQWLQPASSAGTGLPDVSSGWLRTTGSPVSTQPFIPVAVVDTGMLPGHPDLLGKWLPGYDFISRALNANDGDGRDADPSDPGDWVSASDAAAGGPLAGCAVEASSWHGTRVAGQIAAATNNNLGIAGVNWEARIVPVRVGGRCGAQLSDIIDGMRWAAGFTVLNADGGVVPPNANPVRIINLSFGGSSACGSAFQDTIDELRQAGVVVVAAAGNSSTSPGRPANCNGVLGVGALNALGFKAPYSNFGPQLVVSTVGGDQTGTDACSQAVKDEGILSTRNSGTQAPAAGGDDYEAIDGTSFAAPIVSGTISLMLALNPALTVDQITTGVRTTARPHVLAATLGNCAASNAGRCACTTATCGAGVLDTPRALAFAADPVNYIAPALATPSADESRLIACSPNGSTSPGGLTTLTPSADTASSVAATQAGGGSVDMLWLGLLMAAVAGMSGLGYGLRPPSSRLEAARGNTGASESA